MSPLLEIGLPDLSPDELEKLAEKCEEEVSQYITERVPQKSIEQLVVTCLLELSDDRLDVIINIDIIQKYESGHDLDSISDDAIEHAIEWVEDRLREMKEA
ncbi:MAG: hypothetical protein BAJATHORv1_100042 [Candidatus Thorarchaeota archaeon]|nr:MAG: hypothetical protein BAJATHORv1_100042 [Candidatus Thorarchaeota archaeon]